MWNGFLFFYALKLTEIETTIGIFLHNGCLLFLIINYLSSIIAPVKHKIIANHWLLWKNFRLLLLLGKEIVGRS